MDQEIRILPTPKGDVTIRAGRPEDAIPLSELRQQALHDHPTVFGSSYDFRENCSPEWALKVLSDDPQEVCFFIAEVKGILVGMTSIRRTRGQKVKHQANIHAVYVHPDWRGLGIIDAIFSACFDWAKLRDVIILKLALTTSNIPALKAYQRLGFIIFGTEPKSILYDGVYYDEFLMAKEL